MRPEVATAFALGVLLPLLETCRRGISEWLVDFTTMFEDYFAGGLLLIGAWAAYRAKPWGAPFLVVAWAWLTGIMTGSFIAQVEGTIRNTITEPYNAAVITFKFLLLATCIVSLILAFQHARVSAKH